MRTTFLYIGVSVVGLLATLGIWSTTTGSPPDHPVDDGVDAVDHLSPDSHPVASQKGTCGCCDCATYHQLTGPQEG